MAAIRKIEVYKCHGCGREHRDMHEAAVCCAPQKETLTRYECSECRKFWETEKEAIGCYRRHICPALEYDHLLELGIRCYFDCFATCDVESKSAECWLIFDKSLEDWHGHERYDIDPGGLTRKC